MGAYEIKVPDVGEGIAEVELIAWYVQPGEVVHQDQILVEVMTEKATVEITSPVIGKVVSLGGEVGEQIAVGAQLICLEVEGVGNVKGDSPALVSGTTSEAMPMVEVELSKPLTPKHVPSEKPIASPAVRRSALELGVDLQYVNSSGPAGRILQEDLDQYLATRGQPVQGGGEMAYAERHGEETIPVIGLRRKIAEKMQEAKRRIPHFTYIEEIDVTDLEALRAKLNTKFAAERGKLTVLPLLVRAVVLAVRDFPQMNARYDDDAGVVTRYEAVHLGIATQTQAGLMVPVMQHAEARDLWSCAVEIARLADAARSGKATHAELSGSTLTITSLGALGGIATTPVINYPEVAIIGVNRIVERPVIRNGVVVGRQMMNLSSSFDHRVVDGIHAAEFVQAIRTMLESPDILLANHSGSNIG
ncbi:MAG: 2-oxo acid dehydrogenase subunit E2 [Acidimicrobiaceae bacterium]|nr:2-oxo acid dehydrogenase subunit E2 [Acidimicrobiaceae bacterium]